MQTGRRNPAGWTAPPMWRRPPTPPSGSEPGAAPVRLIVRRVKPTPGSPGPLRHLQLSRLHHRPGRAGTGGRPPPPRRDRERAFETSGVGTEPHAVRPLRRQRRLAGGQGPQPGPWTARIGLGEQIATTKTLRRRFFSLAGGHPLGTPLTITLHSATALAFQFSPRLRAIPSGADRPPVRDPPPAPNRTC